MSIRFPIPLQLFSLSLLLLNNPISDTDAFYTSEKAGSSSEEQLAEALAPKANRAFRRGEMLKYRLHYGLLQAGEAVLEVQPKVTELGGRKVFHIVAKGYTTGTTDWFYKVRDRYETYMDEEALVPWYFVRRVDEGGFRFSQDYVFDHYSQKVNVGQNQIYKVPDGIQDMVSAFYSARVLDLSNAREGDRFTLTCFMDKEVWPMQIRFIRREVIETDLGKLKALLFRPMVQKGRVFKQDEDLSVWISDDDNHIPLRAEAKILVGSVKMDLTEYRNLANPLAMVQKSK